MPRKRKGQVEDGVTVKGMSAPPPGLTAVFEDGDGGYEAFPVVMFVVFEEEDGDIICGLISAPDGMTVADHDEDFVGYRFESQKFAEFLEDHARESVDELEKQSD